MPRETSSSLLGGRPDGGGLVGPAEIGCSLTRATIPNPATLQLEGPTMCAQLIRTGARDSELLLLFAHGSGMAMDDPLMTRVALGLAAGGIEVVRFEFPYMQARRAGDSRRPPDPDDVLTAHFRALVEQLQPRPHGVFIGGWSLGARIAAQIAAPPAVAALVCVSYPFHPVGEPRARAAVDALARQQLPTLIVQGSRDAFGNREQVRGYALGPSVDLHWVEDANHGLRPRARSGLCADRLLDAAIERMAAFVRAQGRRS